MQTVNEEPYFLYIEDDTEDVELLKYCLSDTRFNLNIVHMQNGEAACTYLERIKDITRLPEIIFLDINMSKLNGKETYICLKAIKDISKIPIVVLSTSNFPGDIHYFKNYNVPYVNKCGNLQRYREDLSSVLRGIWAMELDFTDSAPRKTDA